MVGGDYYVQVGEADFSPSGGTPQEVLIIQKPGRGDKADYSFNMPSKLIWNLTRALAQIIRESEVEEVVV